MKALWLKRASGSICGSNAKRKRAGSGARAIQPSTSKASRSGGGATTVTYRFFTRRAASSRAAHAPLRPRANNATPLV